MSTKVLRAFISAPAVANTRDLRAFLRKKGVTTDDAFSLSAFDNVSDALIRRIRKADFVVAVLHDESAFGAYELGVADALARPVFAIARAGSFSNIALGQRTIVHSSLEGPGLWRIALSKFVDDLKRGDHPRRPKSSKRTVSDRQELESVHAEVRTTRRTISPLQAHQLTHRVLQATGASVVAQEQEFRSKGADFVLWDDALASFAGGPLPIEVKAGKLAGRALKTAETQLSAAMQATGSRLALLLYLDREGRRFQSPTWTTPFVIRFDLEDFTAALTTVSIAELLIRRRNKLAHGVG